MVPVGLKNGVIANGRLYFLEKWHPISAVEILFTPIFIGFHLLKLACPLFCPPSLFVITFTVDSTLASGK